MRVGLRVGALAATTLAAFAVWVAVRSAQEYVGPPDLHVALDAAAALAAAACGAIALIRYYTQPRDAYLLIGAGFVGAAVLELWHVVVSSSLLPAHLAGSLTVVSPWSFMVARTFLAGLLLAGTVLESRAGERMRATIRPAAVYLGTGLFTAGAFLLMASFPLPPAYQPQLFIARPFELIPGLLFAAAFGVELWSGRWRSQTFSFWLVIALALMMLGQGLFMAQSQHLYGPLFFAGHIAKLGGFALLLTGLLANVLAVFRSAESAAEQIRRSNTELRSRNEALDAFSVTLQALQRITMGTYASYDDLFADYLQTGCATLGLEIGLISEVRGDRYIIRAARSPFGWQAGDDFPLEDMFCAAVIAAEQPVALDHLSTDPQWADHPTQAATGIEMYVGAPIYRNRAIYGTLCFSSAEVTDGRLRSYDRDLVNAMAQTVSRLLEREEAERRQQEVDRMKDEFLSVVSHELRTPLTSIRGSLGLLAGGVVGALPEKGQRMLEIAAENTDRLVRLINDILDIEKMQAGKISIERRAQPGREVVDGVIASLQPLATHAAVLLEGQGDEGLVHGDPDRIHQALTNLIGNAIKFSPPGGVVDVVCSVTGTTATFTVRDRGRGIPPERLDSVFERFAQVDSSDARDKGGTGLGLPIAKEIVELHGGRMTVHSEPGVGSTFTFTIPAQDDAQASAELAGRQGAAR